MKISDRSPLKVMGGKDRGKERGPPGHFEQGA